LAITRQKKEEIIAEVKQLVEVSPAILAADNEGLTVEQVTDLRNKARESGCSVKVAKNRLVRIVLQEAGRSGLEPYLTGPTMLITHPEDPVTPAKVLADFSKDCEKLVIKAGLLREDILDAEGVKRLAKLPGKPQLQSEFAGLINSLVGVVYFNAQNMMSEFSGLVDAQKEKLEAA